ncbi:hypothetical protein HMPREF9446_00974 [Bacteroides fluxus YIT 12057]|uniref:Uncharacterized protein n=1 Tax=Bacteroides fluxus YIT 12057 TaxID=763034 RepID=F3PQI0_9BACE|nr:hypothetical protein HMPREF9446_00974 [Bacteroides fluxus YIT 12057]
MIIFCISKIVVSLCPHTKAMKNKCFYALLSIVSDVYHGFMPWYDKLKGNKLISYLIKT